MTKKERKRYRVILTKDQRVELLQIVKTGRHITQIRNNALILLGVDEGEFQDNRQTGTQIALALKISRRTVDRTKKQFIEEGFDSVLARKKSSYEHVPKINGEMEAHLIAIACSTPPEGHAKWTLRMLADKLVELEFVASVSHETVRQTLKKKS